MSLLFKKRKEKKGNIFFLDRLYKKFFLPFFKKFIFMLFEENRKTPSLHRSYTDVRARICDVALLYRMSIVVSPGSRGLKYSVKLQSISQPHGLREEIRALGPMLTLKLTSEGRLPCKTGRQILREPFKRKTLFSIKRIVVMSESHV